MELKQYQEEAVAQLVKCVKRDLGDHITQKIYLEAPTGAGKTVIASAALEELAQTLPYDPDCLTQKVAFIWIAPNKLHEQSYLKMKSFFRYTNSMRPIVWDELDHSLGYLEHGDVLFLNWPSITRDDNLILRDTEQRDGLLAVVRRTQLEQHTPIVVVIDEEHLYSGKTAQKAFTILLQINPNVEIRISATPNYPQGGFERIAIDRRDVVKEEMIKKNVVINPGVSTQQADDEALGVNAYFLKMALQRRKDLADRYAKIGGVVNPLLLIQLPNDNKNLGQEDRPVLEAIKAYLSLPQVDITEQNGKLAIWLSDSKVNLDDISRPDSLTEVLVFKEAISKGWDCPRAAVLLIYRDMKSYSFTVQTVGRILRMPQQHFYSDDALNHGYVFTNLANEYIEIKRDEIDYISKDIARRRNNIENIELPAQQVGTRKVQNTLGYRFYGYLKQAFTDLWHLNEPTINFSFEEGGTIDPNHLHETTQGDTEALDNQVLENRKLMAKQGIDLDIHRLYLIVPKDMTVDATGVGVYAVPKDGKAKLARTQGEVNRMFTNFCMENLIRFDKRDSTKAMEHALLKFMNDYLQFFDSEAKKIILYNRNRPSFVTVMRLAQERYARDLARRQQEAKVTTVDYTWMVPEVRAYNGDTHHVIMAPAHALQPFYELNNVSNPELEFRKFLEQHREEIAWWYKNGDSGRENFAIAYTNSAGRPANFFVDFVIRLRDGHIYLFDTKSMAGDAETVNKHNALLQYIDHFNEESDTHLSGGIIIEDHSQWLYSQLPITNAADHAGWSRFL